MIQHTQSSLYPNGNCWQTAIASILDLPAETLPPQAECDEKKGSYHNRLNEYLERHHGLRYVEVQGIATAALLVREPGWHLLCGPTVRTPETGQHHVVVARYGEMVWDPHPSRAGLTRVRSWGLLVPVEHDDPESIAWRAARRADGHEMCRCYCPACAATPTVTP